MIVVAGASSGQEFAQDSLQDAIVTSFNVRCHLVWQYDGFFFQHSKAISLAEQLCQCARWCIHIAANEKVFVPKCNRRIFQ